MNDAYDDLKPDPEEQYLVRLLLAATTRTLRDDALEQIQPDDFADPHLGGLWAAAQKLAADGKRIDKRGLIAAADGPAAEHALYRLGDAVPRPADYPLAVARVKRCAAFRRVVETADRIRQRAFIAEDPSQALAWAFDELNKLDSTEQAVETRGYRELLGEFEHAMKAGPAYKIIPSPWPDVNDRIAGGFQPGRLYVVGGRPGDGKSIVGHQAAEHAASTGHPALVFSVEMDVLEVTGRMVANGAQIEASEIARRDLTTDSWHRFAEYRDRAIDYPIFVNDRPDLGLDYIKAECRTQKRRTGLDLVTVDYLQLVKGDRARGVPRHEQVAQISRSLKLLARELEVAVIVPAQLNRRPTERGKPLLADLRESGGIEADADAVILLARQYHTEGPNQGKPTGYIVLDLAKNRFGRTGEIELPWRGHYSRIG